MVGVSRCPHNVDVCPRLVRSTIRFEANRTEKHGYGMKFNTATLRSRFVCTCNCVSKSTFLLTRMDVAETSCAWCWWPEARVSERADAHGKKGHPHTGGLDLVHHEPGQTHSARAHLWLTLTFPFGYAMVASSPGLLTPNRSVDVLLFRVTYYLVSILTRKYVISKVYVFGELEPTKQQANKRRNTSACGWCTHHLPTQTPTSLSSHAQHAGRPGTGFARYGPNFSTQRSEGIHPCWCSKTYY